MKFSGKVGNGPMNKRLNLGTVHTSAKARLTSVAIRIRIKIRIRIATLVRRALAEVCTVPVLLVS